MNKKCRISKNKFFIYVLVFITLVLPSPFLDSLGFSEILKRATALFLGLLFFFTTSKKITSLQLVFIFLCFFPGCVVAIHYLSISYIFRLLPLFSIVLFYPIIQQKDLLDEYVDIGSKFLLLQLIGAVVGFIYVFFGGDPIFTFQNPDTRINGLYLTTFSNSRFGNIVRPAGIYDEPGALSFFVCAICALRIYLKKNEMKTFLLIMLGFITFSLTHFFCFLVVCLCILKNKSLVLKLKILCITCLIVGISVYAFYDTLDQMLFTRLDLIKIENSKITIVENNRISQFDGTIRAISEHGFFWGIDGRYDLEWIKLRYGDISSNPLTPLANQGFLIAILYYIFIPLFFLLGCVLGRFEFIVVFLLFLQRPFFYSTGYTFFFFVFTCLVMEEIKNKGYFIHVSKARLSS